MDEAGTWHGGIGLSPGDFVLDGDPAPLPQKGAEPPLVPFPLWSNGWMHQDAFCHAYVGLSPGNFVLDGEPVPPPQ